ncbi:MAG: ferritin-like domain-containing protein [Alphaproteobacteria bacterium]|nr:ferritin-like domain-containing protein [Alphaproteobacteria bacterium]
MRTTTHALLPSLMLAAGLSACRDAPPPCQDAAPILDRDGVTTGYVRCADGSVDRVGAVSVAVVDERAVCEGTEEERSCETAADCTEAAHGNCLTTGALYDDTPSCTCAYSCATDSDCGAGQACVPADLFDELSANRCVSAECTRGADCESGACGVSAWDDGCGFQVALLCRDGDDECRSDEDCDPGSRCGAEGWATPEDFVCNAYECAIGRSLLVDGTPRTAPHSATPPPGLAAHWARVAAMEHASVASFARFTLQLMALGAPPELLADAHAAGLDEIEHARLAYGLAGRFAGHPLSAGPLPLAGLTVPTDPGEVLRGLVAEACVGETLGVAEAHAALQGCTDPETRAVLARIVADEERHAGLAWRTLNWLLDQHPHLAAETRRAADDALAALTASRPAGAGPARPGLPAWGLLSSDQRLATRRRAATDLVLPLLHATLSPRPGAHR